jgi:hypothetical protein
MKSTARPRLRLQTIILAVAAVILIWLVVSRSFAAYLADVAPRAALWLSPQQPEALENLADAALNGPVTANEQAGDPADQSAAEQKNSPDSDAKTAIRGEQYSGDLKHAFEAVNQNRNVDLATVRKWAESALMQEPLNAHALRILGQVADAGNDAADASKLMQAAAHLSRHESVAVFWLMQKSREAKDFNATIYYADVLLRTQPNLSKYVLPMLAQLADDKQSLGALKAALARDPPWRPQFFAALPNAVTDPRTPLDLLLALRTSSTQPTSVDLNYYLRTLIAQKFYDLAYYTWLQFLTPEQLRDARLLFNGNFDAAPSGLPFDWDLSSGSGVTVDIVPRPDKSGAHALLVEFLYGRVDYRSVTELVKLPPGNYQFAGKYKGQLAGPRGLKWRVVCAEAAHSVGESPMITGLTRNWRDVTFGFTIPPTDCRAQYVRLDLDSRMPSEQLVSGSLLFTELEISRVAKPPS